MQRTDCRVVVAGADNLQVDTMGAMELVNAISRKWPEAAVFLANGEGLRAYAEGQLSPDPRSSAAVAMEYRYRRSVLFETIGLVLIDLNVCTGSTWLLPWLEPDPPAVQIELESFQEGHLPDPVPPTLIVSINGKVDVKSLQEVARETLAGFLQHQ